MKTREEIINHMCSLVDEYRKMKETNLKEAQQWFIDGLLYFCKKYLVKLTIEEKKSE